VHTHLYHAGVIGRLTAKIIGIQRVVVHQHGVERARSSIRSLLDRITSPMVSQYVATCQAVADVMQQREGIPGSKITVIYNGVELSDPTNAIFRKPLHDRGSSPMKIICIGRLSPEKGHYILLEALADLKTCVVSNQLILIGEGKQHSALAERSAQPDLAGRVNILGTRSDIPEQLAKADIFVLPSDWEGVSMALLEAMAAGLPVVATAVGGTPEVVVDGKTGFLVPPHDSGRLADALSRLLLDPDLRQRMGQAGRERAFEQFNILHTVQQTQALYERLSQS